MIGWHITATVDYVTCTVHNVILCINQMLATKM